MIRNELFRGGICISAEIIDLAAGTIAFEELGVVKSSRALTDAERAANTQPAPVLSAEDKLGLVKVKIAELETLSAPLLVVDVAEKLIEIKDVL